MAHYDQFRDSCLVPPGNTSDLRKSTTKNLIDDALGFTGNVEAQKAPFNHLPIEHEKQATKVEEKPRKHLQGKAEGARYCYLSSLAAASPYAGCPEDYVARELDNLVGQQDGPVSTQVTMIKLVTNAAMAMDSEQELWDGVVAVRYKAIVNGKYSKDSYKEHIDKELLLDAAARHLISYMYIDPVDAESGENHLCHVVANVLMYAEQLKRENV